MYGALYIIRFHFNWNPKNSNFFNWVWLSARRNIAHELLNCNYWKVRKIPWCFQQNFVVSTLTLRLFHGMKSDVNVLELIRTTAITSYCINALVFQEILGNTLKKNFSISFIKWRSLSFTFIPTKKGLNKFTK